METNEIIASVVGKIPDPTKAIFAYTAQDLSAAIVRRLGEEAMMLTPDDLLLAREEVQAAISHYLDEREFIDIGLDSWEIVRHCEET